jgi:hypothetical protein
MMRLAVFIALLAMLLAFLVLSFIDTLLRTTIDNDGELLILPPIPTPTPYIPTHETCIRILTTCAFMAYPRVKPFNYTKSHAIRYSFQDLQSPLQAAGKAAG